MNIIAAVDENWGIGYKNDLLFHLKEDMRFFKEITTGKVVIMGRKTFDSMKAKPLPNRINIIVSHDKNNISNASKCSCSHYAYAKKVKLRNDEVILSGWHVRNTMENGNPYYRENTKLIIVNDFDVAYEVAKIFATFDRDIFIIGGSSVYEHFLPKCKYAYISKLEKSFENVDTYFPKKLDEKDSGWVNSGCVDYFTIDDGIGNRPVPFSIIEYENTMI